MTVFLHVGLGKTGTTTLQQTVFPEIARNKKLHYLSSETPMVKLLQSYQHLNIDPVDVEFPTNSLISSEGLAGWDPMNWESYADMNLKVFGAEASIIITLREPEMLLTSIYVQRCLHEGNILTPDKFFLSDELYSRNLSSAKYAVQKFSYSKLISLYKNRFHSVTVVKMEDLSRLNFVNELWDVNASLLNALREKMRSNINNRSYSVRGIEYTFILSRMLKCIGLQLFSNEANKSLEALDCILNNDLFMNHNLFESPISKKGFLKTIVYLFARELKWRHFVQRRMDRLLPYKKYKLNFENLSLIPIDELKIEYENL